MMADRDPMNGSKPEPKLISSTEIMHPNQYAWMRARSELTPDQRMDLDYLNSVGLLVAPEPEQKPYVKKSEKKFEWDGELELIINGVKIDIDDKMMKIKQEYFDKAKRPPLRKYVEALQSFGYSKEKVNKVIDRHIWMKTHKKEMQAEFDRLWPPEKKKMTVKKALKAVVKH